MTKNPFPIVPITVPWAWRAALPWPHVNVYEREYSQYHQAPGRYAVPLGAKYASVTELSLALPGYVRAAYHVTGAPYRASSQMPPWVDAALYLDALAERLIVCEASNVSRDRVFYGCDLRVHVQPYSAEYDNGARKVSGFGLVGVEVLSLPADWTPIPQKRIGS